MSKMTYRDFDTRVQETFAIAQENLNSDGVVQPVLLGFNAYGKQVLNLAEGPEPTQPLLVHALRPTGFTELPGPFRDRAEVIGQFIAVTKTVALIHVSEAWTLLGREQARGHASSGGSLAEHPNRVEILLTTGLWPREFYAQIHTALIVRDASGKPTARSSFSYGDNSHLGPIRERMVDWLTDLLPQPYARR